MFFLNLTGAEFLTLLGALGGLVTALYLLDRAKRRKVVSTLRFWVQAGASEERQSRRKMRDPWSLLLQLLSLLLLLLALSRMQWGSADQRGHDHVLLLDTSSWTAARAANSAAPVSVLDREKELLRSYLGTLPRTDRALLVAVDALATPLTRFTADRHQLTAALDSATTSFSALNLDTALSFARQAESFTEGAGGEIVYAGPQMISDTSSPPSVTNLRVLPVIPDRANDGIRQLTVQQLEDEPNSWQAFITVKNYSTIAHALNLAVHYGVTAFSSRRLALPADGESTAEYSFTTRTPGEFAAVITPGGSLVADDRASLLVPHQDPLTIAIYTDRPQILKPLLESDRQLTPAFYSPSQYNPAVRANVVVLDRFSPGAPPAAPALWIDPPKDRSPIPVKAVVANSLLSWNAAVALPGKQIYLPSAAIFETFQGDNILARVPDGPVVITREARRTQPRRAIIGFDPAAGEMRFEVTTPLLFADLLEFLDPTAFRTLTLTAESVGLASLSLDPAEQKGPLTVTGDHGAILPFSRRAKTLQFFVDRPSTAHITSAQRERVISLRLPAVADKTWHPPTATPQGLPAASYFVPPAQDLWKWLAVAAAACLLFEWFFFGPSRRLTRLRTAPRPSARQPEEELISR